MKITPSRILARRILILQTLTLSMLIPAIIVLLKYLGIKMPFQLVTFFACIVQPGFVLLMTKYRMKKGDDGKILKKWQARKEAKLSEIKSDLNGLKTIAQKEYYAIQWITPERKQMCVFRISFSGKVMIKAMPIVYLNGTILPIKKINNHEILCYAEKAITADTEILIFQSGKSEMSFTNPYYMPCDIPLLEIAWQCEGHTAEKNICINANYFPNKNEFATYAFNFLIGGRLMGTYSGYYVPESKSIVIGIASIKKSECLNKECVLKPAFDIRRKIVLPKPMVIVRDGTPVKEVAFS